MERVKNISASIIQGAIRRKADEQKYQEEVYGTKRKTQQSKGIRVDKRLFNKGRPKKIKVETNVDINITPNTVPVKKLNQVEKVAAEVIGGYLRSKLQANILQPAIYSDLIGIKVRKELDMKDKENVPKKRGRPKKNPIVPK